jgi:hypothetical protein
MCARYVAGLPDLGVGHGVNIPGFEAFGADLLSVTRARHVTWLALVTDAQRPEFEANAAEAAARLDASGALAAQVRADGIRAVVVDARSGARTGYRRAPRAPLYAAAWAHAPHDTNGTNGTLDAFFLADHLSEPLRAAALRRTLATSAPAATDLAPYSFVDPPGSAAPCSVLYAPAWPAAKANATYGVGIAPSTGVTTCTPAGAPASVGSALCALSFRWQSLLEEALPRFVDSIVAVLRSPAGAQHTFSVSGRAVRSIGSGDLHARLVGGLHKEERRIRVNLTDDVWNITLYPTPRVRHASCRRGSDACALGHRLCDAMRCVCVCGAFLVLCLRRVAVPAAGAVRDLQAVRHCNRHRRGRGRVCVPVWVRALCRGRVHEGRSPLTSSRSRAQLVRAV